MYSTNIIFNFVYYVLQKEWKGSIRVPHRKKDKYPFIYTFMKEQIYRRNLGTLDDARRVKLDMIGSW